MSSRTFIEVAEQTDRTFKVWRKGPEHGGDEGDLLAQLLPLHLAIREAQKAETSEDLNISVQWLDMDPDAVMREAVELLLPMRDPDSITKEEAEALPIDARVAAFGEANGQLDPIVAIWRLCELGLQKRLELAVERREVIPVYLWASYKPLMAEMDELRAAKKEDAGGEPEDHKE